MKNSELQIPTIKFIQLKKYSIFICPHIDGSTKQLSYILKTALDSENKGAEIVKSMNLFPKEMKMYSHYLPKFEELYKEAGLHVELAPKCLVCEELPERSTLVLEDLSLHNFKNMDRLKGFDLKYARLVVEKLAELHAASAVYEEIYGPYEAVFHHSFMNETNKPMYAAMYEPRTAGFKKSMLEWGLPDVEKYIEKMLDFETYFAENMRINTPDPLGFNVLNHGDMWTNNIMFSHNSSGQVEKTLFIDFQICKWGSPVQDLWYIIATSMQVDIRAQEFDNIIAIYHKRLVECLKVLKFSKRIPSLKDLQIKMLQNSYWGEYKFL